MSEIIRYEQPDALATAAPIDRFDELLQQGQIAEALDLRMDAIESSAKEHRTDCEAAKLSAVGLAGAGLLMSASPVIGLLGALGAVAYGVVLFQDFQKTKRFCPIPAVRKTLPELLTGVGNAADRVESKQVEDPLADTLCFLEPPIAHEYELLQVREIEMQRYLQQFPPAKRLLAYRVALRQTRLRDTLSLPTMQQAATADENLQPDAPEPAIEYADYAPAAADEPAPTDAIDVPVTTIQQPSADYKPSSTPTPTPDTQHPIATSATDDRFAWAKDLLHFPAVLIWGAQGSGKTSFAAWLLHQRIAAGHSAWVCDPHKEFGQWNGLKCVGAGMDYEACDRAMIAFANTIKREYKTRSEQANYQPQRETVLVEEFTNWANRCENAGEFFAASLSDLRKIKKGVIFVSHDRSLIALGNAKGFSKARNNGLLELHLEAVIDPATGDPKPAMKGKLKLPGKAAIEVEISPEMCGSMDFTRAIGVEAATAIASDEQQRLRDRLESLYRFTGETQGETDGETISPDGETGETVKRQGETGETPHSERISGFGETGETISRNGETAGETGEITPDRISRICEMKRAGLNQTQIIAIEWGAKPGKSQAYLDAVAQYKAIIDSHWKE